MKIIDFLFIYRFIDGLWHHKLDLKSKKFTTQDDPSPNLSRYTDFVTRIISEYKIKNIKRHKSYSFFFYEFYFKTPDLNLFLFLTFTGNNFALRRRAIRMCDFKNRTVAPLLNSQYPMYQQYSGSSINIENGEICYSYLENL